MAQPTEHGDARFRLEKWVLIKTVFLCLLAGCAEGDRDSSKVLPQAVPGGNWAPQLVSSQVITAVAQCRQRLEVLTALRSGDSKLAIELLEIQQEGELMLLGLYDPSSFPLENAAALRKSGELFRDDRLKYPSKWHSERTGKVLEDFMNDSGRQLQLGADGK